MVDINMKCAGSNLCVFDLFKVKLQKSEVHEVVRELAYVADTLHRLTIYIDGFEFRQRAGRLQRRL